MPTSVLIIGQARTFARCWRSQYWYLYRKLNATRFYLCIEDDEDAVAKELIFERYSPECVKILLLPKAEAVADLPAPSEEFAKHAPYPVCTETKSIMKCFWNYARAWECLQEDEKSNGLVPADLIVRTRPDAFFHNGNPPKHVGENDFVSLWWERYGGVNDRVVFMGRKAAEVHFTMINRVDEILAAGAPLHGESFVGAALELGHVDVHHTLDYTLSLVRKSGEMVHPACTIDDDPPSRS